jgi:hypothetical protein
MAARVSLSETLQNCRVTDIQLLITAPAKNTNYSHFVARLELCEERIRYQLR